MFVLQWVALLGLRCVVNVMIQGAQVIDIDYRCPAGIILPNDKQCAYAVENCMK